ncbi:MAG: putative selenium-dependent hydroxylase accessory protein YqeC [Candidatus Krumholzibacteriota bacterium]|nr:putative selenium-dependent hydroxylase accessory protein YqeC [Candidatus Krumholzibacteriota bacterium]
MGGLATLLGAPPDALRGAAVAVLGSGGKTSLLATLARELAARHPRVLLTTTTQVLPFPGVETVLDPAALPAAFGRGRVVLLGARLGESGKVHGDPAPDLAALRAAADVVLLEGDGAGGLPLKRHLPDDPPAPPGADLVLMVAGAAALDRPVREVLHRFDRPLAPPAPPGPAPDVRLDAEAVADLLLAPGGYLDKAPGLPLRWLVNQADAFPRAAADLAAALARRWAGPVLTGSAREGRFRRVDPPGPHCSLVVLAAGGGERFGGDKRLFPLRGRPLLDRTLAVFARARLRERIVVLGPAARDAGGEAAALARARGFRPVFCEDAARGRSASLRAGLAALSPDADSLLLALGDMPALRGATVAALLDEAARRPGRVLRPAHGGRPGHPVLLPRATFEALAVLEGDHGPRDLLPAWGPFHLEAADAGVILDLDEPAAAAAVEAALEEDCEDDAV